MESELRRHIQEVKQLEALLAAACTEFGMESLKLAQTQNLEQVAVLNREIDVMLKNKTQFETLKKSFSPSILSKTEFKSVEIVASLLPSEYYASSVDQQMKHTMDQLKALKENAANLIDVVKEEKEST